MPPPFTASHTPNCWQQLADLLDATGDNSGLQRVFPVAPQTLSILAALESAEVAATPQQRDAGSAVAKRLRELLSQLQVFELVSHCPVVALTGLLNAGKSSLLATYLSPQGRSRVLRGVGNDQGTHRFVIWLPQIWWSDRVLLSTLTSLLTTIFGHPPEQLSGDIAEAQQQYNGMVLNTTFLQTTAESGTDPRAINPLTIPLIASDPALDSLRLGLVDCPDIQTGFLDGFKHESDASMPQGEDLAATRRDQLGRIGRLCSAFIIVSRLSSLHDEGLLQILTTLRDAMPGVPRILAINKVKSRYAPEVVFDEARALVDRFGINSVFAAYDYRSSLAEQRIPKAPTGLVTSETEPQPIFTYVGPASSEHSPYLYDLSQRLDAGALARESHRSLSLQLQALGSQAMDWLNVNDLLLEKQLAAAWQAIADACFEFMSERDETGKISGLRLQASPAILAQMADSLQRTAPTWMRFSMMLDRTARQIQQAVSNSAARIKLLNSASNAVVQFAKSFRRGEGAQVVTAQQLADAIRKADYADATVRMDDDQLIAGCEVAMKWFAEEDTTLLEVQRLDELTLEIWSRMPLNKKLWQATQPLALLTGPFLAAMLIPFDGGGTTVLVFASMKELLIATGLAAVLGPTLLGDAAIRILQQEAPWRQLENLFAQCLQ